MKRRIVVKAEETNQIEWDMLKHFLKERKIKFHEGSYL